MDDLQLSFSADRIWREIRNDALQMAREENELFLDIGASELLAGILQSTVLQWHSFEEALAALLASKLSSEPAPKHRWHAILHTAFTTGSSLSGTPIRSLIMKDLIAIKERDPACPSLGHAFLYFKGFHGIQLHRAGNWLWRNGQRSLASLVQSRASEVFGMDIHPAAQLGSHIMIDHATGVVIGETARVGNGCTLLHGVTLGGNGKQQGDRHPKLGTNVLVGAGASILGNVTIGDSAKIGASAVVLSDIPSFATAVGCPAKVIGKVKEQNPASAVDHSYQQADQFRDPMSNGLSSATLHLNSSEIADQLQNVCGLEVSKEDAMPLFFERKRSTSSRLRKQPSDMEVRNLQYSAPTCVCST
ncbi:hypothetical protein L7F22_045470 [Adiantum nelumboides]|nr:hypothetical protein [Adiantum nelumboides]